MAKEEEEEEEEEELPLEEGMALGPGSLHRLIERRRAHGCGGAWVRGEQEEEEVVVEEEEGRQPSECMVKWSSVHMLRGALDVVPCSAHART